MQEINKLIYKTWEQNGKQYEYWCRSHIDITDERRAQMAQNLQDYYSETEGHRLSLKNAEKPTTPWAPRDWRR